MHENMNALSCVSNHELRERLSAAVRAERAASADVIFHLAELDRRKLSCFPFHATRPAANPRLR